jgi:perosamine synthetase
MSLKTYLPFGRPCFGAEEIAALTRVLRSGWVGMGPETQAFEAELAAALGAPQVVTVNSCTSALFLALLVQGVGPGDEVICPSLTWCSTANAALYLGAQPVFCDVDPETLNLTPATVKAKLTSRTRAVMAVHFGGLAVEVEALQRILPPRVTIIEDGAHALGARYADGRPVGASGNLTCFSFYANKNLSTGEGGAIALCDEDTADRLRSLRQHGMPVDAWKRFSHPRSLITSELTELGFKMNYTDLQAGLGRVQLQKQAEFAARRLKIAARYCEGLAELKPRVQWQQDILHPHHARHLFVVQLPLEEMALSREELLLRLRAANVGATVHYAPLHLMPLYQGLGPQPGLPVTEGLWERLLTLPISASMQPADAGPVMAVVRRCLKQRKTPWIKPFLGKTPPAMASAAD